MEKKSFTKLPLREEYRLLKGDDAKFSHTAKYLRPLIEHAVRGHLSNPTIRQKIEKEILSDIPTAARRFLSNPNTKKKKIWFCIYFTWYIAERINATQKSAVRAGIKVSTVSARLCQRIFALFAALNAMGYDDENNSLDMHPARKTARRILSRIRFTERYPLLKTILRRHHPWYFLHLLFAQTVKSSHAMHTRFTSSLTTFARDPLVQRAWRVVQKSYTDTNRKLLPHIQVEAEQIILFLGTHIGKPTCISFCVNLLDAFWRGYSLSSGRTGYIVVGPGALDQHRELIRHELFHLLAPSLRIPNDFLPKNRAMPGLPASYSDARILRREYVVRSLNLLYARHHLGLDITQSLKDEQKIFPNIERIMTYLRDRHALDS